jgi:DNA-binding GntR family transcriptional regulator
MSLTEVRFQPLNILNLRRHIEGQMRSAILNGTFRPGERLVESAIADQLGVSRAPVREVLSALEREGLVVNHPRRGNFVVDFTEKDIEEIYSLRNLLEVGALRRAIDRFTAADLAQMQSIVDSLGELTGPRYNHQQVVTLDLVFHEHICRIADHGRLLQVWNSMRLQTQLLIGLTSRTHLDQPGEPREHHQAILNAIMAADLQRAEADLTKHMQDAQRRALMALQQTRALETDLG